MSKVLNILETLPNEQKSLFSNVFGSVKTFYEVIYLIVKNEHVVETQKTEHYDERLKIIRAIKNRAESLLTSYELNGKDIIADISSEYFEDYVNYKEVDLAIEDDEFISIVKKLSQM